MFQPLDLKGEILKLSGARGMDGAVREVIAGNDSRGRLVRGGLKWLMMGSRLSREIRSQSLSLYY